MERIIKFFGSIGEPITFGEHPYHGTAVTYRGAMGVTGGANSVEGPVTLYLSIETINEQRVAGIKLGEFGTPGEVEYLGLALDISPWQGGRDLTLQYDPSDNPGAKELLSMMQQRPLIKISE